MKLIFKLSNKKKVFIHTLVKLHFNKKKNLNKNLQKKVAINLL